MPDRYQNEFQIFTPEQITSLRRGGKILGSCLQHVATLVKPGVHMIELDHVAEEFICDHGGKPGFKGYGGFPATLCTSVNDACVHGFPSNTQLNEGDIIGLDCGVLLDDLYTDACITVAVGQITPDAKRIMAATEEALVAGIAQVRAGARTGDVSFAIHSILKRHGFDSVSQLTGHGLGDTLHQFPMVPNIGKAGSGPIFPINTIVAIEPISTAGSVNIKEDPDHWTLRTQDGSLSAHFEHTVLITDEGCEILTDG